MPKATFVFSSERMSQTLPRNLRRGASVLAMRQSRSVPWQDTAGALSIAPFSVRKGADDPLGVYPNLKRLLETIDSRTFARARVVCKDAPSRRVNDEAANHRFGE